jgi:riboflavin synthase
MFSWIIEKKAKILEINNGTFTIENIWKESLEIWESIAHDWACMTITQSDEKKYSFFVMEESIKKTNFLEKKVWDSFNVEKSLKLSDSMNGHFVSWHIDTTGSITKILQNTDKSLYIYISFDKKYKNLIIEKWSIAISWVSLTIVEDLEDSLSVSIIPLTQEITNLWELQVWNKVNLEFDILWKYINKITQNSHV